MKSFFVFSLNVLFFLILSLSSYAEEQWILDKDLSSINFELPILFNKNVKGSFDNIEGLVIIDMHNKENNKAIFSANIDSIDINYKKYKNLLLSNIFFDSKNFPKTLIDTNKFSYKDQTKMNLNVDLIIKDKTHSVPLTLKIDHLTNELVQIKGKLNFSRTKFNIGTGKWKSTIILRDKVTIKVNLFLFKN